MPAFINDGRCLDFAYAVRYHLMQEKQADGVEMDCSNASRVDAKHCWLTYNGQVYDAEAPEGVKGYKNLPLYRRSPGR